MLARFVDPEEVGGRLSALWQFLQLSSVGKRESTVQEGILDGMRDK